jgi:parallel beta-helix repeat protein
MCKKLIIFCFTLAALALSTSAWAAPQNVPFVNCDLNGDNLNVNGTVIDATRTQTTYPTGWPQPWSAWDLKSNRADIPWTQDSYTMSFGGGKSVELLGKSYLGTIAGDPTRGGSRNRGVPTGGDDFFLSDVHRDLFYVQHSDGNQFGYGQDYIRFTMTGMTPNTRYEITFWAYETSGTMVIPGKYIAFGLENPADYMNAHPLSGGMFTNSYGPTNWDDPCTTDVNEWGIYKNPIPTIGRLRFDGPLPTDDVNMAALGVPVEERPFYYSKSLFVTTDASGAATIYIWGDHDDFDGSQHMPINGFAIGLPGPLIYVDVNATGANNGSSWADAYKYLQDALVAAGPNNVIWVAQGTYKPDVNTLYPDGTNDRTATFQLKNKVTIYGGFPTGGGLWDSRDPNIYETVLSGDINAPDDNNDNSYHVVNGSGIDSNTILDGFTVTAGNANGNVTSQKKGGGMYNLNSNGLTVTNCTFSDNAASVDGGGMYNASSDPCLRNCIFSGNSAGSGGGMNNDLSSDTTLVDCIFIDNSANNGGGMYNASSAPCLRNCIFNGNLADDGSGGGIYNYENSSPTLTNCTFTGNSASTAGGGVENYYQSNPTVTNCILWGNTAPTGAQMYNEESSSPVVSFSDVQDSWAGTGNIDADPLFVDANGPDDIIGTQDDDLRLLFGSLCINAGDPNYTPAPDETDLAGNPRVVGRRIDMGAYEDQLSVIYVDADATGANNGLRWADAYKYLQNALTVAEPNYEIWVAKGTYQPDANTDHPTGTGDRTATFQLKNKVAIYGGFPAGGGTWQQRDPNDQNNETILNGDLDGNDVYVNDPCDLMTEPTRAENSYHVATGSYTDATAILDGFTVTAGNANSTGWPNKHGGGMFNSHANCTIKNCTFVENSSTYGGGMAGNTSCDFYISNCTFLRNAAMENGGGIDLYLSDNPVVINCTFSENVGINSSGGGISIGNSLSPTLTDCIFSGNSADYGGGISNYNSSPTVTNCTFIDNKAAYFGGGMHNTSYNPTVTGCTFIGNSAEDGYGGGICNDESDSLLTNCTFSGNKAAYFGGGIFNISSRPTVTNCTFTGNSGWFGGGMSNWDSSGLTVANCSFSGNSADHGGGIDNWYFSNPTLTNCILWGNTAIGGAQIYNDGTSSSTVSFSNIQDGWAGTGNINANPLFVDADGPDNTAGTEDDNPRLSPHSPCIDAGDNNSVPPDDADLDNDSNTIEPTPLDLDYHPRFTDGDCNGMATVDMGAFEFSYTFIGDFEGDCDIDLIDFAIFAKAWLTEPPDPQWNQLCDIGTPPDDYIDWLDLDVLAENWLQGSDF